MVGSSQIPPEYLNDSAIPIVQFLGPHRPKTIGAFSPFKRCKKERTRWVSGGAEVEVNRPVVFPVREFVNANS